MSDEAETGGAMSDGAAVVDRGYADGEWHRLHPATPLLRGGIALIAIIGFVIAQMREQLINSFFGGSDEGDPVHWLSDRFGFWLIATVVLGILLLFVLGFYLSWRMHTFRITDEVVEVRSGILFRTNRRGRLDRIQGINIIRPFIARLFGAANLEVTVAGQNANVQLSYLSSAIADSLRADILRLASGATDAAAPVVVNGAATTGAAIAHERVAELLDPDRDLAAVEPTSIVTMHPGRVIGSILLSTTTVVILLVVGGLIAAATLTDKSFALFGFIPGVIGLASYYSSRFARSVRFTIASTPDGIRIGYGLLSTTNDTLPPGRIHSVQVSQPLLWRPAGWWEIKVNRAGTSSTKGSANQGNTTILPVGNRDEVRRVLALVLPSLSSEASRALLESGFSAAAPDDGFTNSPRRAVVLRWFSWRRNGFAVAEDAVLLRTGVVWRQLVIVPLARLQSVCLEVGWLRRRLRLATVRLHTVAGPISPVLGAIDDTEARSFFARVARDAVTRGSSDTSQRWRENG